MAYEVWLSCDTCAYGIWWKDESVSKSRAITIARQKGWQFGKAGCFCPYCVKRRKKQNEVQGQSK